MQLFYSKKHGRFINEKPPNARCGQNIITGMIIDSCTLIGLIVYGYTQLKHIYYFR